MSPRHGRAIAGSIVIITKGVLIRSILITRGGMTSTGIIKAMVNGRNSVDHTGTIDNAKE
jgi:hypothetical protein